MFSSTKLIFELQRELVLELKNFIYWVVIFKSFIYLELFDKFDTFVWFLLTKDIVVAASSIFRGVFSSAPKRSVLPIPKKEGRFIWSD